MMHYILLQGSYFVTENFVLVCVYVTIHLKQKEVLFRLQQGGQGVVVQAAGFPLP